MGKIFVLVLIFASAFADSSMIGNWALISRRCSSNAPANDGISLNYDHVELSFKPDNTFRYNSEISNCNYWASGTYKIEGSKLTETVLQSQSCNDLSSHQTRMNLQFYQDTSITNRMTLITTGSDAAAVCPANDMLISRYTRLD